MSRVYFHIDLNAFFATAETLLDPSLKGKPVAVSGSTRRSVVSTASYEARKYGVHSAMPIQQAMKLCPDLIVISGHYSYYSDLSHQFMDIIGQYSNRVEQASIDECYVDITETIQKYPRPLDLAWEIQQRILKEVGLPCSIGVGPNLFLAKMASDMKKPMGITVLRIRDVKEKMWPLPISEMRGIGKRTLPFMQDLHIHTIGDLATYKDIDQLKHVFGKNTDEMIQRAHGYDHRELMTEYDAKSMGVSETLLEDVTDYDELRGLFRILAKKLSARLKHAQKAGYHVSIRITYYDFHNADRSVKLNQPVWKFDDLFVNAMQLFDEHYEEGEAVRLLGLSVSDFITEGESLTQLSLFDDLEGEKESTYSVISDLNHMLGNKAFYRASALLEKKK